MKQNIRNLPVLRMVLLILLSACAFCAYSQVTVGTDKKPEDFSVLEVSTVNADGTPATRGGLRLPQLYTAERNAWRDYFLRTATDNPVVTGGPGITDDQAAAAEGLAIFNLDTKCYEYWNAKRWVSLCEGNSQMTISPEPCLDVLADGTGCDNEFEVTDPDCLNGPFTIMIVAGQDYAALRDVDELNGRFRISFRENNTTRPRTVVVRVTSSCTGLSEDFLFVQLEQVCNDALGEAPAITATPAGNPLSYCAGGAVYLSIDERQITAPGTLADVIWTLNGLEIARGVNFLEVTREGTYDIHMGVEGCGQRPGNAVTVTKDGNGAPKPPSLVLGNNGQVCDQDGTTQLVAMNPNSTGDILWFKDGMLQDGNNGTDNITGTQVTVGVGEWFAVVQDGTCLSRKSATVSVTVDPGTGTSLTVPQVDKSGTFCAGSTILLNVTDASFDPSYTYIWYENNTQIATGRSVLYNVPAGAALVVIRCRATLTGSCAKEALSVETVSTATVLATPRITGNTVLCSGTATLNVVPVNPGTYTYAWYKDNNLIGTAQTIMVTQGGDYYATVTEVGGCTSPMAHINIPATSSSRPTVTLNSDSATPEEANVDDLTYYSATFTPGPATGFMWDIPTDIAELVDGGGNEDSYARVRYKAEGSGSLKVTVTNACGDGSAQLNIDVKQRCAVITAVTPSGPTTVSTVAGVGVTLGPVSATFNEGTPVPLYKWYSNNSPANTGGNPITGATNSSYTPVNTTGTYYYYCEVDNSECPGTPKPSGVFTVNVAALPTVASVTNATACGTGSLSATLSASASAGAEIRWYAASSGGAVLATGTSYTITLTANKTYYVAAYLAAANYETTRTAVTATVYANTITSSSSPQSWAGTSSHTFTLTAAASAGSTVRWFDNATTTSGGTTGNSISVTRTSAGTTTKYARAYNASCPSPFSAPVAVTVETHEPIYKCVQNTNVPTNGSTRAQLPDVPTNCDVTVRVWDPSVTGLVGYVYDKNGKSVGTLDFVSAANSIFLPVSGAPYVWSWTKTSGGGTSGGASYCAIY